ncbi:MAG: energy-coupling factor ABC transporter ATP-binding protein [Candidatus Dormibacteraeota bacterium]|nr:energy-coupling factor ABC transporter ATP-binding protein [Candidatus Dormibacteraeota bacterium]
MDAGVSPLLQAEIRSARYYAAPEPALSNVCLSVSAGEFVVITGPAASGKSTLCYCLTGVIPHAISADLEGDVVVAGHRLLDLRLPEVAPLLGFVFQAPENQLFNLSVREDVSFGPENLLLPIPEIQRRVAASLDFTGMGTYLERASDQLSGGEAQRVVLSCILALEAPLLVLDQPAAELDPQGRRQVYENLHRLNQAGKTIVVVEDRLSDVAGFASRIILMNAGRVVADQPIREFFSRSDLPEFGIRIPDTVLLHHYLKDRGMNGRQVPLTVEEVVSRLASGSPAPPNGASERIAAPAAELSGSISQAPTSLITISRLAYSYPNGARALDDVSLRCGAGEFLAIIGENGAGKTTLAKHLIGLLPPPPGTVLVAGADIAQLTVAQASRRVGYLFQDPDYQIFNGSVFDEVAFGLRARKLPKAEIEEQVMAALRRLRLDHLRTEHPYTLSRGQRQRLALASTWVLRPPILLVDEPSTGLDHREAADLMSLLEEFRAGGGTVLIITHDLELVFEYAQRVVVMRRGTIRLDLPATGVQERFEEVSAAGVHLPQFMHLVAALGLPPNTDGVPALGDAVLARARG